MKLIRRRGAVFVTAVLMVVLSVTSAAWACTVFLGSITLQGNASTNAITFFGNGTGMGHMQVRESRFCQLTRIG